MAVAIILMPSYICCGMIPLTRITAEVICTPGKIQANIPLCTIYLTPVLLVNFWNSAVKFIICIMDCFYWSVMGALM